MTQTKESKSEIDARVLYEALIGVGKALKPDSQPHEVDFHAEDNKRELVYGHVYEEPRTRKVGDKMQVFYKKMGEFVGYVNKISFKEIMTQHFPQDIDYMRINARNGSAEVLRKELSSISSVEPGLKARTLEGRVLLV